MRPLLSFFKGVDSYGIVCSVRTTPEEKRGSVRQCNPEADQQEMILQQVQISRKGKGVLRKRKETAVPGRRKM